MMFSKKLEKGRYGYITEYKKVYGLLSLGWIALILMIYAVGYIIFKDSKNLMTAVAVLAVLPAARKWVAFIIMIPYKGVEKAKYDEIRALMQEKKASVYADHVITKYEGAMYVPLAVNYNDNLYVYAPKQKKTKAQVAQYLNQILKDAGSSSKAQVYEQYDQYVSAIKRLAEGPDLASNHKKEIEKKLFIVTV